MYFFPHFFMAVRDNDKPEKKKDSSPNPEIPQGDVPHPEQTTERASHESDGDSDPDDNAV